VTEDAEKSDDFIRSAGLFFLAHRLRRLSDEMVTECEQWFAKAGIIAPARTTSMLYLIENEGPQRITAIASVLRQFHPVTIDWVGKLKTLGLITTASDPVDRRRTIVSLTATGRQEVAKIRKAEAAITAAYASLGSETGMNLINGVDAWETALSQKPLSVRIEGCLAAPLT